MTREEFFLWAEARDSRWEFDGFEPVAMTGGTVRHDQIASNIQFALRTRLRGGRYRPFGPNAGLATVGDTVRYPDALVTCADVVDTERLVPGVVVVFEVLSPTSLRVDRIVKLGEYQAVPSILRYIIVEHAIVGVTVLERSHGDAPWTASAAAGGGTLHLPEIGIEIPVADLYEQVALSATSESDEPAG